MTSFIFKGKNPRVNPNFMDANGWKGMGTDIVTELKTGLHEKQGKGLIREGQGHTKETF
jgi:hypothetical protein